MCDFLAKAPPAVKAARTTATRILISVSTGFLVECRFLWGAYHRASLSLTVPKDLGT
jgi:hypothetical protein